MNSQRGMTLIEIAFATAILSGFLLITMIFMGSLTEATGLQQQVSELDCAAEKAIEEMAQELQSSFIPGTAPNDWRTPLNAGSDNIRFQMPVDYDGDGDDVSVQSNELTVDFGSIRGDYTPGHFLFEGNGTIQDFYVHYRYIKTGTFSEAFTRTDLNMDGDLTDTWDVGYIEKQYPQAVCTDAKSVHVGVNAPEVLVRMTPEVILRGDFDGDGVTDPLFVLNGTRLVITLETTQPTSQKPLRRTLTTTVEMRNM